MGQLLEYWNADSFLKMLPQQATPLTVCRLIDTYNIEGQHIHDTYLVATMLDNNVKTLYTADETMRMFKEITVINPFTDIL